MFERYTEKGRRVIFFARYETGQLGAKEIEPEHILLGLLREDQELMRRFLPSVRADEIRKRIEEQVGLGEKYSTAVDVPLSTASKRALAYAQEESERLQHRYIGTEHLLLGLLREGKSIAAEILRNRGLRLNQIRDEVAHGPHGDDPAAGGTERTGGAAARAVGPVAGRHALDASALRQPPARALFDTAFGRFSRPARFALFMARDEAGSLGAESVDPEHLLLGVLHVDDGAIAGPLPELDGAFSDVRAEIASRTGSPPAVAISTTVPFSARSLRALATACEAAEASASLAGLAHLLLGIAGEQGSLASELLAARGVTAERARAAVEGSE